MKEVTGGWGLDGLRRVWWVICGSVPWLRGSYPITPVPYDQVRFVIQIVMERCKTSGLMAMFLGIDLGIDIDKQKSIGSS